MKDFNETKNKSIAHYDRMIAWAETQPENDIPFLSYMEDAIGENWQGMYCKFCNIFAKFNCKNCPISIATGRIGCSGTSWYKMGKSYTWGEWLIHAKQMRELIRNLENNEIDRNITGIIQL